MSDYLPSEPSATGCAWVNPYGAFYAVPYHEHEAFAASMWDTLHPNDYATDPVGELERAGWLHISNPEGKDVSRWGVNIECRTDNPTAAQFDTLGLWAASHAAAGRDAWVAAIQKWMAMH